MVAPFELKEKNIRALQSSLGFHQENSTFPISWIDYIFSETTESLHPYIMIHYGYVSTHPKVSNATTSDCKKLVVCGLKLILTKKWFELCHVAKASEGQCWAHEVKEVNLAAISRQHKTLVASGIFGMQEIVVCFCLLCRLGWEETLGHPFKQLIVNYWCRLVLSLCVSFDNTLYLVPTSSYL